MTGRDDVGSTNADAAFGDDELTAAELNESQTAQERADDDGAESGLTPAQLGDTDPGSRLSN